MHGSGRGLILHGPGEGELIEARGTRIVIKVANASQTICEYSAPGHFPGPPLHVHPGFDETFLVQQGRIELVIGDRAVELTAGASAHVSGSVPHTFRNLGAARATFLLVCCPGGFEHYFRGLARGDTETVAAISQRFGYADVEGPAEGFRLRAVEAGSTL